MGLGHLFLFRLFVKQNKKNRKGNDIFRFMLYIRNENFLDNIEYFYMSLTFVHFNVYIKILSRFRRVHSLNYQHLFYLYWFTYGYCNEFISIF